MRNSGMTLEQIAKETGIKYPTLYRHYRIEDQNAPVVVQTQKVRKAMENMVKTAYNQAGVIAASLSGINEGTELLIKRSVNQVKAAEKLEVIRGKMLDKLDEDAPFTEETKAAISDIVGVSKAIAELLKPMQLLVEISKPILMERGAEEKETVYLVNSPLEQIGE